MAHPLARIPATVRGRLLTVTLLATLGLWGVALFAGAPLTTPIAPGGIISFELAGTLAHAQAILASWDASQRLTAAFGLGLDYLFLVTYSTFFALACLSAGEGAQAAGSRFAGMAELLAWGQWVAAALDAVENAALVSLLFGSQWAGWAPLAWFCASVKFALIGAALIYIIWGAGLRTMEEYLGRQL